MVNRDTPRAVAAFSAASRSKKNPLFLRERTAAIFCSRDNSPGSPWSGIAVRSSREASSSMLWTKASGDWSVLVGAACSPCGASSSSGACSTPVHVESSWRTRSAYRMPVTSRLMQSAAIGDPSWVLMMIVVEVSARPSGAVVS